MVAEFKSILDLIKAFPTEQDCIAHLEKLRWDGAVVSPFDADSKVYKCSNNRYKCKNTGKYFNVKVGTIFEDTKIPLIKWFMALYIFSSHKKGISSHQLARDIDVTQKTAWFILHRLRYAFEHPAFQQAVNDVVEVDETYMGGEEKNKHESKRNKNSRGRGLGSKKPVVGILQRDGSIIAKVTDDTKLASVQPLIDKFVEKGSVVITDEWVAYNQVNRNYDHYRVSHGAKQFVNGMAHTNGIENFWSHLKRGIDGIYHWCSVKHLQRYVDEFSLRFNTRKMGTAQRFDFVLGNISGKLAYKVLIG
ncbi:IS1595 family transposase [Rufibacter immobilis]|uniref:IS1595 family transposase n=1 Tax=Rufibacter immobilis TaxID=1348778 RepID=UPI0035EC3580